MSEADLRLVHGQEARELLAEPAFRERWWRLYDASPWATANQRPDFALAWYEAYQQHYDPLLVVRALDAGSSAGVFSLALERESGRLCVAGDRQIDYAAWLCDPEQADDFAIHAMTALSTRYAGQSLRLRYLAAGLPDCWLETPSRFNGGVSCQAFGRPVLKLDDPERISKILRKKSNKSRLNRLKRAGDVEITRLETPGELERWLDEIALYCDLRQGAISDSVPFFGDPQKRPFHLKMMAAQGLLYCTVMRVGGELAAAIISLCSQKSAAIGLFAISPRFARHSPGKLLVYETGLRLAQDGYTELDLTPGGDEWKNRFADTNDPVVMADIHLGRRHAAVCALRSGASRLTRSALSVVGVPPARLKALAGGVARLGPRSALSLLAHWKRWLWHTQESRIYRMDVADAADLQSGSQMAVDQARDLLHFVPRESWQSRAAFLSESTAQLGEGVHLYSKVEDGVLVHHGWFSENSASSYFPEIGERYEYPEGSAVLYEFYTDPGARGRGLYQQSLHQMLRDAAGKESIRQVYISVRGENLASRHVIEKVGFHYQESLFRRTRLGRSRCYRGQSD